VEFATCSKNDGLQMGLDRYFGKSKKTVECCDPGWRKTGGDIWSSLEPARRAKKSRKVT